MEYPSFWGLNITSWFLIIIGIICILYDIFIIMMYGRDLSISYTIATACKRNPEFTFISGLVIGHIFLSIRGL